MLVVDDQLTIASRHIEVRTSRSGGPGGQHVNKTETQVALRLDVRGCEQLDGAVKERLLALGGARSTKDGVLQVVCGASRDRLQNLAACEERLRDLVRRALAPPPPPRKRRRVSLAAKARRVSAKREIGEKKAARTRPGRDD